MADNNLFVILMGMGTVFFGLVCLIVLTYIMGAIIRPKGKKNNAPSAPAKSAGSAAPTPAAAPVPAPVEAALDRETLAAVITAAVAQDLGTDANNIRIHSIQPAGSNRQAMVAAIAAAIAEDLGVGVNGIRIHSIKQL